MEGCICQLEILLCNVKVIEPGYKSNGVVDLGSAVVLREGDIDTETFTIVGAAEADPKIDLISNDSTLAIFCSETIDVHKETTKFRFN